MTRITAAAALLAFAGAGALTGDYFSLLRAQTLRDVTADPDRIAELGSNMACRVFPRNYNPALTTRDVSREAEKGIYPLRPLGDAGVVKFSNDEQIDVSCPDLDHEVLELKWLGMFRPKELHTLSVVPNRIAAKALEHVRYLQIARMHVGFRSAEEVQALARISSRLEEIYLYEVPPGLFEFRTDRPQREWSAAEREQLLEALKYIATIKTLRSVKLSLSSIDDGIATALTRNRQIEIVDLRGHGSKLSDVTLLAVAGLPNLRECTIELGRIVKFEALDAFRTKAKLERLELRGVPPGGDVAIAGLKRALPTADIIINPVDMK